MKLPYCSSTSHTARLFVHAHVAAAHVAAARVAAARVGSETRAPHQTVA